MWLGYVCFVVCAGGLRARQCRKLSHLRGPVYVNFHCCVFSDSLQLINAGVFFSKTKLLRDDDLVAVEVGE